MTTVFALSLRARSSRLVVAAMLAFTTAACGPAVLPSAIPAITDTPVPPTAVVATPVAVGPPAANLRGLSGRPAPGADGSFTWDGLASDAPWVVGPSAGAAAPGTRLEAELVPRLRQRSWQARWAPIAGGQAGDAIGGGSGLDGSIVVVTPARPGAWSLQITASFGPGRSATWYWRVEVSR